MSRFTPHVSRFQQPSIMTPQQTIPRLRRSLLFMPGNSLRKIEKAIALGVDSIVMDLEDGVALSQKERGAASLSCKRYSRWASAAVSDWCA